VTVVQRCVDHCPDAIRIAKYLIVPEAYNAIALVLDHMSSRRIDRRVMLTAVYFDHQLGPVTRKVRDEMAERNLPPEMLVSEALPQDTPELALCIRHVLAQAPSARDRSWRRMMLQRCCSMSTITPPLPLPIKARGS